jgi:hypothetical protein
MIASPENRWLRAQWREEMLYIVEIGNGFGLTVTKEYCGFSLREVLEDAEADIWKEPHSFIKRVWPQDEERVPASSDHW